MKKSLLLAGMLLLNLSLALSQVPFFQTYSLLRKNEPVQINAIFQDKTGLIWLGTNKGLFRFDGINYKRYTRADSLPDENVTALQQDSLGRIWIGYKNGKLSYLEKNVIHSFEAPEGSASGEISDLLFDKKGNLWFSTLNDGLYYFVGDRLYRLDEVEGLPDLFIYDIEEDSLGNVWAGTDGGIAICTLKDKKVEISVLNNQSGLPDNIIKRLLSAKDGTMWIGTEDAGLFNYDPATKKYTPLLPGEWQDGSVSDFLIDGDQVWIASSKAGLQVTDVKAGNTKIYGADAGFVFTAIRKLLRDREGNIWTGSKTGVMRTLGDQLEYIENFQPAKDVNIVAVTIDQQQRIWFANSEGLFLRTVDKSGKATTEKQLVNTPYQKYTVISLYADSSGYVWAGLYGEGVIRINSSTHQVRYLNHELRNGNILSISGHGKTIWLATLGGGTRIVSNGDQLAVTNYGTNDGLSTDYIYQVFVDSKRRVWFGTDGKGVDMLDQSGFHHYQKGLNSKVVYGFAEDGGGTIWVNVQSDGLYRLENDLFVPFAKESALRDNNINGLASDQYGNMVVMHDLGIDIIDTRKHAIRYLSEELGIHNKKANLNATAKDNFGHLFFGTDEGIIKYSNKNGKEFSMPDPLISELKIFDKSMDLSKPLVFDHNENDININYLGLWYQNPENLNFRYLLENYDRDWIHSRDHAVTYSSLPPGNYVFHLQVSETGDFKDAQDSTLAFEISPPFWRTSWFYLLCAIVFTSLVYSFIRYRERALQRDNKILEDKVRERTIEIQRKTEEIQVQNEEIHAQTEEIKGINENLELLVRQRTQELELKNKSLEEYAFINAHELRAPVASILGLINLMRKIKLDPDQQVYLEHLQKSADRLDNVCTSITRAIEKGDS